VLAITHWSRGIYCDASNTQVATHRGHHDVKGNSDE